MFRKAISGDSSEGNRFPRHVGGLCAAGPRGTRMRRSKGEVTRADGSIRDIPEPGGALLVE